MLGPFLLNGSTRLGLEKQTKKFLAIPHSQSGSDGQPIPTGSGPTSPSIPFQTTAMPTIAPPQTGSGYAGLKGDQGTAPLSTRRPLARGKDK